MANDLTSYSVGLQIEYTTAGSAVSRSVGIQAEYETAGEMVSRGIGLQVEYSEWVGLVSRAVGIQAEYTPRGELVSRGIGVQLEYSQDPAGLTSRSVGLQFEYAPFKIYGFDPTTISDRGGEEITITGDFIEGETYTVEINGELSYGGFGSGFTNAYEAAINGTLGEIKVWSPPLPVGSGYSLVVTKVGSPSKTATAASTMTVDKASFTSNVFSLRTLAGGLPRKVGAVDIKDEK